jgi:hypothetical protein
MATKRHKKTQKKERRGYPRFSSVVGRSPTFVVGRFPDRLTQPTEGLHFLGSMA